MKFGYMTLGALAPAVVGVTLLGGVQEEAVVWQFDYDAAGGIVSFVYPGQRVIDIERNTASDGTLENVSWRAGGDFQSRTFDDSGNIKTLTSRHGTTDFKHDGLGRLIERHRDGQPSVYWTHDTQDRISTIRIGSDWQTRLRYDYLGRLAEIETPAGIVEYQYDTASGRTIRTLPNGVRTVRQFNPDATLASLTDVGKDGATLRQSSYTYRADKLIKSLTESTPDERRQIELEYDLVHRLTGVQDSGGDRVNYAYDAFGNRTSRRAAHTSDTWTYDWSGQLDSQNGESAVHDRSGNVIGLPGGPDFEYGPMQELQGGQNGTGVPKISYRYDGDGNLIERTAGDRTTQIVLDPFSDYWRPLAIVNDNRVTYFVWDSETLIASMTDDTVTYYLHDHLSSVRATADSSGKITERVDYSPFGQPRQPTGGADLTIGFAGMLYDPGLGIYLTPGRPYHPRLGRFLQLDPELRLPLGAQEDLSLYPYCANDPFNYTDRLGTKRRPSGPNKWNDFVEVDDETFLRWFNARHKKRSPRKDGYWLSGDQYDGLWKSTNPKVNALTGNQPIRFKNGMADFTDWRVGDPVTFRQGVLNGNRKHDAIAARKVLMKRLNLRSDNAVKNWLKQRRLILHHVTENRIDLVPHDLHKIVHTGPASDLERWALAHKRMQMIIRRDGDKYMAKPIRSLLDSHGSLGTQSIESASNVGGALLGGIEALDAYLGATGKALMGAFGEAGLDTRHKFDLRSYIDRGVVAGYTGHQSGILRDGSHYLRTGRLEIDRAGIHRLDQVSITGRGRQYSRSTDIRSRGMNAFANLMQGRYPLIGYDPSDKVLTKTGSRTVSRQVTRGGISRSEPVPFDRLSPDDVYDSSLDTLHIDMAPHRVGGVFLGGADRVLDGIGPLRGLQLEEKTGRIVLIADEASVNLPPLRIDDVVVIFRTVYDHGSVPWVSIDPDPKEPEHADMHVRLAPGLVNTYVGWVLMEADRVMKSYQIGVDNISRNELATSIPGHRHALHESFASDRNGPTWQRFWIRPAAVQREDAVSGGLALLDVQLEVATQAMVFRNGQLHSATAETRPSQSAEYFTRWFTDSYPLVAAEWRSNPPVGSSSDPVPVFHELRQFAMLTAVALELRDRGEAMPAWMEQHAVEAFPFDLRTPPITIEATSRSVSREGDRSIESTLTRRVTGGVALDRPADGVQRTAASPRASRIAAALASRIDPNSRVEQLSFDHDGRRYRAGVLPGADSAATGGLLLTETDLRVPMADGSELSLSRFNHSFHKPDGEFGPGWTLDLPTLRKLHGSGKDQTQFSLTSPIGSVSTVFNSTRHVPELNGDFLVPDSQPEILALARVDGRDGNSVLFRDGRRWHFDENGALQAVEQGATLTEYLRNSAGYMDQIIRYRGGEADASITLEYDALQRVTGAWGSDGSIARYDYGIDDVLSAAETRNYTVSYDSEGTLIREVRRDGESVAKFEYNGRGQLLSRVVSGVETRHTPDSLQHDLSAGTGGSCRSGSICRTNEIDIALDSGEQLTFTSDAAGRITSISEPSGPAMLQEWHPNGQLASRKTANTHILPRYDESHVRSGVLVASPPIDGRYPQWSEIQTDRDGRPVAFTDSTGLEAQLEWRRDGQLARFESDRASLRLSYDDKHVLREVETSWGLHQTFRDGSSDGKEDAIEFLHQGEPATVTFRNGRIQNVINFDGGMQQRSYDDQGNLTRIQAPDGLVLRYAYDQGRLASVNVGNHYEIELAYTENDRIASITKRREVTRHVEHR